MSKNNGNGESLTRELVRDLNSGLSGVRENLVEILAEMKAIRKDMNDEKDRLDKHLQDHEQNPETMSLFQFLKKLGIKGWIRWLAGISVFLILLALLLSFAIEKIGFSKIFSFLNRS